MSKYILIKEPDATMEQPCITVRLEITSITISEVIETFEQFLLACGYSREVIEKNMSAS